MVKFKLQIIDMQMPINEGQ